MKKSFSLVLAATAACLLAGCSMVPTVTYPILSAETTTNPNKLFDTAYVYEQGLGTPRDYGKAIEYYSLAAKEQNDARALNNLGVMAVQGRGFPASVSKGLSYFRKASAGGSAAAHYNIGLLYDAGVGVGRSPIKAVAEYRMAAEMGHGHAQARLSQMLRSGDGAPVNEAEAQRLYEMAATRGISGSITKPSTDLSTVASNLTLENCTECHTPDRKNGEARQLSSLKKLADEGDAVAQYNLGVSHLVGKAAVLDPSEAARLFTISARQGFGPAQRQLAQMHLRGQAVAKSKVLAHAWLNLAAKGNGSEAEIARQEMVGLEISMSADEVRQAQEIAESGYLKGR